ncbi:YncE family protein [Carnimonas bestiolae]|uniref:YncE family protein n=1 Tax=Carnimonas bestiolae TaxID=3402172 RepID=UPI003EDB7FE5
MSGIAQRARAALVLAGLTAASGSLLGMSQMAMAQPAQQPSSQQQPSAKASSAIAHQVALSGSIYEIAYDAPGNAVYVAVGGAKGESGQGRVIELDASTLAIKRSIVTPTKNHGLYYSDKLNTLFSTNSRSGQLSAIRLGNELSASTVQLVDHKQTPQGERPAQPREVVAVPDSDSIYVTGVGFGDDGNSSIWKVNGRTLQIEATFEHLGKGLTGLAVSPDGKRLFATAMGSDEVLTLDAHGKVLKRFSSGGKGPLNVAYDAKGGRLFVVNSRDNSLAVLDSQSGKPIYTYPTSGMPISVAYDADHQRLYVANRKGGDVDVIDSTTYQRIAQVSAPPMPNSVALDSEHNRAFVTSRPSNAKNASDSEKHDHVYEIAVP